MVEAILSQCVFRILHLILFSLPHWVSGSAAVLSYTSFRPHRSWQDSVRKAFDLKCALSLKSAAEKKDTIFYKFYTLHALAMHLCVGVRYIASTSLTQAPSLRGISGSETAMYSFLVHTATTSTPSMVKKASNPVPLAVKKLGESIKHFIKYFMAHITYTDKTFLS